MIINIIKIIFIIIITRIIINIPIIKTKTIIPITKKITPITIILILITIYIYICIYIYDTTMYIYIWYNSIYIYIRFVLVPARQNNMDLCNQFGYGPTNQEFLFPKSSNHVARLPDLSYGKINNPTMFFLEPVRYLVLFLFFASINP